MSQGDPLYPSSTKSDLVDSDNNNLGESNMIKESMIEWPSGNKNGIPIPYTYRDMIF